MIFFNSRMLILGAVFVLPLSACKPTDTPASKETATAKTVATVNGTPINENQVNLLIKQSAQGQPVTDALRKEVVDHLSVQLLLSQEASKKGLDKQADVADQLELTRQSILAKAFVQDQLKSSPMSDETLKAEYEKIKGQMAGNEFKARHILVDNEADAKGIIAKLTSNPKLFASLAKEKSKDPGSKGNGGDLGWFDPRAMVPEFGAALGKLTKGNFTPDPVKSQFGYHVILLEDTRPKTIPPLEQIKPALQQQLQQQNLKKLLDDLKAKAKIEIVPPPAPAAPAPAPTPAAPAKDSKPAEAAK